jgi:hypothetical protein
MGANGDAAPSRGRGEREEARGERSERSGDGGAVAAPRRALTQSGSSAARSPRAAGEPPSRRGVGSPPRRAPSRNAEARAALQASIAAARKARCTPSVWDAPRRRR